MDEQIFEATADPLEVAARLGLGLVQRSEGGLYVYVRDKSNPYSDLYSIGPINPHGSNAAPADLRLCLRKEAKRDWAYVGEYYHSPREAAAHAGLTVIGEIPFYPEEVVVLDGFGRKYEVRKTGNGPRSSFTGWASDEEMRKWSPKHLPRKRTHT